MPSVYARTIEVYDAAAARYRDWWAPILAPAAERLLDTVAARVDTGVPFRLLDVGTGSGALALAALERWRSVHVVATDPSTVLLGLVTNEAHRRGAEVEGRLTTVEGAAARLPLPDASVDVAVSSFVIQLVPSRAAALREAYRVVRPGGRFACVTWQAAEASPFEPAAAFDEVADELEIERSLAGRDPRPWRSPAAAAAELRRAGFRQVQSQVDWLEHAYTPKTYLGMLEHWSEDDLFARLDALTRRRLRSKLLERLARLPSEAYIWRRPLISVIGRRPGTP